MFSQTLFYLEIHWDRDMICNIIKWSSGGQRCWFNTIKAQFCMSCSMYCIQVVQWICFLLQVLLTLPPAARQDYFPLLSEPLLMLEQLLMNLKVDWADVAVRTLRSLLIGQEAGFGPEDIDKLLADYAGKALDFSCAPRERSRSGQCSVHIVWRQSLTHVNDYKYQYKHWKLGLEHMLSNNWHKFIPTSKHSLFFNRFVGSKWSKQNVLVHPDILCCSKIKVVF